MSVPKGWGLSNYCIIGLCGMCTLAEAIASVTVLIVAPLLACDLNYTKDDAMSLNATSSLGMAFGGFFFGIMADACGRKLTIPITMVVIFCSSIGIAFSQTYFLLNFCVLMLGVGVAGNNATLRVYVVECLPAKRRGTCLAIIDSFWLIGYVFALGTSWLLVPSVVRSFDNEFRPSSWRVLAGLGAVPTLIMACMASLLPPSPRYLLCRREPDRALAMLQQMYAINYSRHAQNFPPCELEGCIEPEEIDEPTPRRFRQIWNRYFVKTWKRILRVCQLPRGRITIFGILSFLGLFPGFIWFALWDTYILTESINWTNKERERLWSMNNSCIADARDLTTLFLKHCHQVNDFHFKYFFLISFSYFIGEILLSSTIDIIGRRIWTVVSGIVGATALITIVFSAHHSTRIVSSVIFLASYSINYTTTTVSLLESYPTSIRGTATGILRIFPHLTSFLMKYFMKISCLLTIYVTAGFILISAIAASAIADLTNAPMHE